MVKAHDQQIVHKYTLHYPDHPARKDDPHYRDFEHYRRTHIGTARCATGEFRGDYSECRGPLELHHSHVEFAMQNGVNLKWLEPHYPGISNPDEVGAWIESGANLVFYCSFHHRGRGGVHVASAADFEASKFVADLFVDVL